MLSDQYFSHQGTEISETMKEFSRNSKRRHLNLAHKHSCFSNNKLKAELEPIVQTPPRLNISG